MQIKLNGEIRNVFVEIVTDVFCGEIIASELREPTVEEFNEAKKHKCKIPHPRQIGSERFIYDEREWMYDSRYCAICGWPLDLI